jgi:hypothetical protein
MLDCSRVSSFAYFAYFADATRVTHMWHSCSAMEQERSTMAHVRTASGRVGGLHEMVEWLRCLEPQGMRAKGIEGMRGMGNTKRARARSILHMKCGRRRIVLFVTRQGLRPLRLSSWIPPNNAGYRTFLEHAIFYSDTSLIRFREMERNSVLLCMRVRRLKKQKAQSHRLGLSIEFSWPALHDSNV